MEFDPKLLPYYLIGILAAILWRKIYFRIAYGKNGANKTLFTL
jgi:hypothetical protein